MLTRGTEVSIQPINIPKRDVGEHLPVNPIELDTNTK